MKLVIAVCTIYVLFFINSSDADCSDKSWVSVKNIEIEKLLGRWYAVLRFENGKDDNSDCLWHDLIRDPTNPKSFKDAARRSFKTGRSHTKQSIDGEVTFSDPSKGNGRMHVAYKKGAESNQIITAMDYDDFAILRACFDNEGNLRFKYLEKNNKMI